MVHKKVSRNKIYQLQFEKIGATLIKDISLNEWNPSLKESRLS